MTVWCPNVKDELEKAPSILIHDFEILKLMKLWAKFFPPKTQTSKWRNFILLLSLRFYVKSILRILKVQNLPF